MDGAARRVEVNLSSLLSFATDLQSHLELMIRDIGDVNALQGQVADIASLGDFPEGRELTARHALALRDVEALLDEVRQVIAFADDITLWVAAKYAERDAGNAAAMGTVSSALGA